MSGIRSERLTRPFRSLSLTTKGVLVMSLPVCALLAAMVVFYQFEREARTAHSLVEHTFEVRSQIRDVLMLMLNAETATRGYLLTRQDAFLEPYREARTSLEAPLGSLDKLLGDSPPQSSRLAKVRALTAVALESMEAMRRDVVQNRASAGLAELQSAKADVDILRGEIAAMLAEEQGLLAVRTGAEQRAQRRLELAIFVGGLVGLLGGLAAVLLFTTGIARRVHHVEEYARRVAEGLPIAAPVKGHDEIARLERTLQETSELLAASNEELRASHIELESRVAQRTRELSAANEELHKANEVRQAVINSTPVAIWALDLEGRVTFWNPAAGRIFGWSESEVIGRPLPVIPAELQDEFQQWLARFRNGEALVAVDRKRRKKDGALIDVSIWTAPLRDARGRITGTIAIDSDVTERKSLEEQVRQSQKLEAVGRLAGGVAHDFNNLLTVIMGYVEMLLDESRALPRLTEYAQEIQYAAGRASSLTAQLLAFSRRQISQPAVLDLNEIVTHSMKLLRRVIGEDVEIATHLDPQLDSVKADPIHIDQVIMNLVVNARDAMSGGGKLTIDTAAVTLDEHYAGRHIGVAPGRYSMLAISDTGAGMDAAIRSRVFEPFFTTKEAGKGTGLGLAIVYGIVKQSGGEIMVYSEPGQGTTFKIYLPVAEAFAEPAPSALTIAGASGNETILVCEDEAGIRKLVEAMLVKQGYRVIEAESPERALQLARELPETIHLLLTDVVMPQLSGLDLAQAIAELRPQIKVLYMSGYTDNRVHSSWLLHPGTPFLQKPFTAAGLGQKVREALAANAATGSPE